jgi:hypothetical protein
MRAAATKAVQMVNAASPEFPVRQAAIEPTKIVVVAPAIKENSGAYRSSISAP